MSALRPPNKFDRHPKPWPSPNVANLCCRKRLLTAPLGVSYRLRRLVPSTGREPVAQFCPNLLGCFRYRPGNGLRKRRLSDPGTPNAPWKNWCCRTGLNCRPLHYQWSALPLSYGSADGGAWPLGNGADHATGFSRVQAASRSRRKLLPLEDCRAIPYDRSMNQGNVMTEQDQPGSDKMIGGRRRDAAKQERLAVALRQNLNRRKAQSRVRETQAGDAAAGVVPAQDQ